jgi:putative ABC transport system permease protein
MTAKRMLDVSDRWFRLLERLYPPDFREEVGNEMAEAYMDRARHALRSGGKIHLAALWLRALADSLRNGAAERARPAASWRRAGGWGHDIERVGRRLARAPLFTLSMTGTLAIGLGMFAVAYTAVKKVLLDPMPYRDPGGLYYVWRDYSAMADLKRGALAGTDIAELRKFTTVVEDAAGLQPMLGGIFSLREGGEPMEIAVTQTSANLFHLLGVPLALGRSFTPDEVGLGRGRGHAIVLTHHLWNRLGADPGIVGREVRLQGRPHRVAGVLPPDFTFVRSSAAAPPQRVDAYIPLETHLEADRNNGYAGLIRARRGASPEAVAAAAAAAGRAIDERDFNGRGLKLYPVELKAEVISRIEPALAALGAAGVVLAIMLMANLASVLLARAAQREHEVAVSRALGANTTANARPALLEGGLLGLAGGALGTLGAIWGTKALVALAPLDLPRREAISIDWGIGATVTAIGGLLGVLAAAAPAVWVARAPLSSLLAGSAVRGGGGQRRWRRALAVAQVALSLVLLSSSALALRSFERLLRADPGFRPDGVFTVRVRTPPEFFPKMSEAAAFQDRVRHALAAIPGVTGASAASALPLTAGSLPFQEMITIPGAPGNSGDAGRDRVLADLIGVRPDYVEVMGVRLLAGRTFAESRQSGVMEAMIDPGMARKFFPGGNAIGAKIPLGGRLLTITGVAGHARLYDVHSDGRPQILVRSDDFGIRPLYFVIRTNRDPRSLWPEVREAVRGVDARVPAGEARAMEDIVDASLGPQAIGGAMISAFAAGALLLAAMGLYGVVAGSVTRRRHELALRLALGAGHRRLLRLVLREGAVLVMAGLLAGAPGVYIAGALMRGLAAGVSPYDPLTLLGVVLGLLSVTMAACYVPARRALRIDPARLLRQE